MYPIIFESGIFHIYSHGLMVVLGIFVGTILLFKFIQKQNLSAVTLAELIIWSLFGGLIGARFLYVLLYLNQFGNWQEIFYVWNGGMVSFGGMVGGLLTAFIYLKTKKENVGRWFDLSIVPLFVGWAIGRIGCFLNGDSIGVATSSIFGIWGHYQTALMESLLLVIICVIIIKLSKIKKNVWPNGMFFAIGFLIYGLGRFMIDFVQEEPIWFWGLRYGQVGSALTIIFALILIWIIMRLKETPQ